jgi:hypothetical protein
MSILLVYCVVSIALLCRQVINLEDNIVSLNTVRSRETKLELRERIPRAASNTLLTLVWPYMVARSLVTIFKNRDKLKGNG